MKRERRKTGSVQGKWKSKYHHTYTREEYIERSEIRNRKQSEKRKNK